MLLEMSPDRLESLYDTHALGLFRYARSILREDEAARDVLQEVFVKLARSGLPEVENEKAWLYRIAHNAAIDQLRRQAKRSKDRYPAEETGHPHELSGVDRKELSRHLEEAVACLPVEQQSVVRLKLWQELTFEEISTVQGLPLNTAASRYRYAIEKLRTLLHPIYEELK